MNNRIAQTNINLFEGDGYSGFGPLGLENRPATDAPSLFATFISTTIGVITVVAIIWFVFNFLAGAVSIIVSGGDKQALESAKKKISYGIIGLVVTVFALLIIKFFGYLIGLTNILNFQEMFNLL